MRLTCAPSFLGAFVALLFLGCTASSPTADGPRIDAVDPNPVNPGATIVVQGSGFGDGGFRAGGFVSVGGRSLLVLGWTATAIEAVLPRDQRPGPTRVVVTVDGRPSVGAPLMVLGQVRPPDDPPREFPPSRDGGVFDAGPDTGRDGGPRDDGVRDFLPPDLGGRVLRAEFTSDAIRRGAVFMEADTSVDGELTLIVRGQSAWGMAFHLDYDRNLLRLRSASPSGQRTAHTAEIGPGRVAGGQAIAGGGEQVFEMRFVLLGRGEGRITFPARYRTRRDAANQPIATSWTEGSVRIQEVAP